tara:strand:+ start:314 stop:913 length:600 start_codon:yes stop_codon:yes gene_type:complete
MAVPLLAAGVFLMAVTIANLLAVFAVITPMTFPLKKPFLKFVSNSAPLTFLSYLSTIVMVVLSAVMVILFLGLLSEVRAGWEERHLLTQKQISMSTMLTVVFCIASFFNILLIVVVRDALHMLGHGTDVIISVAESRERQTMIEWSPPNNIVLNTLVAPLRHLLLPDVSAFIIVTPSILLLISPLTSFHDQDHWRRSRP